MQTITTKYLGATNTKQARVRATSTSGISIIVKWNWELDTEDNHNEAAIALCNKLGWSGTFYCGAAEKGKGNVYVMADAPAFIIG